MIRVINQIRVSEWEYAVSDSRALGSRAQRRQDRDRDNRWALRWRVRAICQIRHKLAVAGNSDIPAVIAYVVIGAEASVDGVVRREAGSPITLENPHSLKVSIVPESGS